MKITQQKNYYLLKNDKGEYHIDIAEFDNLGRKKAIELATKEIDKKSQLGQYNKISINYKQARELGFCEYGIKDFAEQIGADIDKDYSIKELYSMLTIDAFIEYPEEVVKLFGKEVYERFGGIIWLLESEKSKKVLELVINSGLVDDKILHTLAYKSAMRVVGNYENQFPNDSRVRDAIEAKKKWIDGLIGDQELLAAESTAWSTRSAAYSTYLAAESAAESATWSATWSADSAAWSAAKSAELAARLSAESAAESALWTTELTSRASRAVEVEFQINTLLELLKGQ